MGLTKGAGALRHVVEIQKRIETNEDALGGVIPTFETLDECYASIEPMSGRELFNARQVDSEVTHKVRIRFYDGLTSEHRFLFNGRALNIKSVVNIEERDIEQVCMCQETQTSGNRDPV